MFFLGIKEGLLNKITRITRGEGTTIEETITKILEQGIVLLETKKTRRPGEKTKQDMDFIEEHWLEKADGEMANTLEVSVATVRLRRLQLGLKRKRGRQPFASIERVNFIKEHWQDMSDVEMAKEWNVKAITIGLHRRRLGLKRRRGKKEGSINSKGAKAKLSREGLEQALNRGGKTESDIAKEHNVSRERIRQICNELGVVLEKTSEWYACYWGDPRLADKEWLEGQLGEQRSISGVSSKLGISQARITDQAKRLGIDIDYYCGARRIEIICEVCGKKKRRKLIEAERSKHQFCSRECYFKYRSWKPEEDEFLKENWRKMSDKEIAEILHKRPSTVWNRRITVLGLKKRNPKRWTSEDLDFVRKNYLQMSDGEIAKHLKRTTSSVLGMRTREQLKKSAVGV